VNWFFHSFRKYATEAKTKTVSLSIVPKRRGTTNDEKSTRYRVYTYRLFKYLILSERAGLRRQYNHFIETLCLCNYYYYYYHHRLITWFKNVGNFSVGLTFGPLVDFRYFFFRIAGEIKTLHFGVQVDTNLIHVIISQNERHIRKYCIGSG